MRLLILILLNIILQTLVFGQNKVVKVDTIFNSEGSLHKVINYNPESASNYFDLALKCKTKADSLLKEHFDLQFFNDKIWLDAESSRWYTNEDRTTQIFETKKKRPKKVELIYSILEKNSGYFNLIKVTLKCENEIEIVSSKGIPKTKNYKINIDYNKALTLANKKGYQENTDSESYEKYSSDIETLSLKFSDENSYYWRIDKNRRIKKNNEFGLSSSVTVESKALFINAKTGKTKTKRIKNTRNIRWY